MLEYIVHSCVEDEIPTTMKVGARKANVTFTGLTIELVQVEDADVDRSDLHGHTFRLIPQSEAEHAKLKDLFEVDSRVRIHFTRVKEG